MSVGESHPVLHSIVKKMMEEKNIKDYKLYVDGGTGNGEGYMGQIVIFHVFANNQKFHYVLNSEKSQESLKILGSDILNNRELDMYTKVIPVLEEFTTGKKWTELTTFIPKVSFAVKQSNRVNIVLENLKQRNFHILDRRKPMDFPHMSILFETFGKWHGTSMAFRDQYPEKFYKLVERWEDPRLKLVKNLGLVKQFHSEFDVIKKKLIELGRSDLVKIYESVEDQVEEVLLRSNVEEKDLLVISHGDNWSTNYFFKYEDNHEKTTPNEVYLIDFQLSRPESPALELSSTLYNMGNKKTFEKFDDLLKIYHKSLSSTLQSLGSNPEDLFTINDLKRHWKKHGLYTVAYVFVFLRAALCDPEEAPDLAKMAESGVDFDAAFCFDMQNMDTFWERALDVYIHYAEFFKQFSDE